MELFVLFQGQPLLALIPAVLFACLALLARSRLGWLAAAAWAAYAIYEAGMKARILCSGECNIRVDLLLIGPLLLLFGMAAIIRAGWLLLRGRA